MSKFLSPGYKRSREDLSEFLNKRLRTKASDISNSKLISGIEESQVRKRKDEVLAWRRKRVLKILREDKDSQIERLEDKVDELKWEIRELKELIKRKLNNDREDVEIDDYYNSIYT